MSRKPKFKPVIRRVKLNPEQAVLTCDCYDVGLKTLEGYGSLGHEPFTGEIVTCGAARGYVHLTTSEPGFCETRSNSVSS